MPLALLADGGPDPDPVWIHKERQKPDEAVAMPIEDRQLIGRALACVRKGSQVRELASLSPLMIAEAVTTLPRAS